MTSQLCHNVQASQAVHGSDNITTPNCCSQANSISVCGPQVDRYSYYLQGAGVFNLILLTLIQTRQKERSSV